MIPAATLLVRGARLWSAGGVPDGADALAVADGRILAIGRGADLAPLAGRDTRVIEAGGATLTPGFTDAHIHLVQWARARSELAIDPSWPRERVVDALSAHLAAHPGDAPVIGRGWASEGWPAPPDRAVLDAVAPVRPVILHSRDFHAVWANSAAYARAGIGHTTPDPDGGRFERDASGEPRGVAREHAVRPLMALVPPPSAETDRDHLAAAVATLHAHGITAVHDFEGAIEFRRLWTMVRRGGPWVRVLMHLPHAGLDHALDGGLTSGHGDDRFRVGAVKLFADGTLGSRTAALLAPYTGTDESGMDLLAPVALRETVARAIAGRLSVAVHAIGDRAVRKVLDAFAAVDPAARTAVALPLRIEHAQLVDPADVPRFAALGVAASMQPQHCVTDIPLARRYWEDRLDFAYPWASLLRAGALLAFGSDAPVEPPDPSLGLHAALTRQTPGGEPASGFVPRQRVGLDAAMTAYTDGAARLAGDAARRGRLEPGAWADLVLWDRDLAGTPPADLHRARPRTTILEGTVVYEAAERGGTERYRGTNEG